MALEGAVNIVLSSALWLILSLKNDRWHIQVQKKEYDRNRPSSENKIQQFILRKTRAHKVGIVGYIRHQCGYILLGRMSHQVITSGSC